MAELAQAAGVPLRLLGGVAVRLRASRRAAGGARRASTRISISR